MKTRLTMKRLKLTAIASLLVFVSFGQTKTVSTETLLKEMIDKKTITYFPEYYYSAKQFSSYDRNSDKGDPNDYTWYANGDVKIARTPSDVLSQ